MKALDVFIIFLRLTFIALVFVAAIHRFGALEGLAIGGAMWMLIPKEHP